MNTLSFYRQTSMYTDLGLYEAFARELPDDLMTLCRLQRKQIIHPVAFRNPEIRKEKNSVWGDMNQVPAERLRYEDDLFPTAQSILHELLRRNPEYSESRVVRDKVHVTCRGEALLLCATLKAKGLSARVRSGYAFYCNDVDYSDHWIVEYWNEKENRWVLCDADIYGFSNHANPVDINRNEFLTGGYMWKAVRSGKVDGALVIYAGGDTGLFAALRGVVYDFNCLMQNEMTFLHFPMMFEGMTEFSEEMLTKVDDLAELITKPDENFERLQEVWNQDTEWKVFSGGLN